MPLHKDSGGEVAEAENNRDPNDRIEEFDRELTSATIISWVSGQVIHVPLHYREWFPCSEYHWILDIFLVNLRDLSKH